MITAEPKNWKDLQNKVNYILSCVGLVSEIEKSVATPRGTVTIDVLAYDPNSLDKIQYLVECKNWNKKVPQAIIHGFTTVMQETGANIGYVISKKGFQKGAEEYKNSTNIRLFSYDEFQNHYFLNWYCLYFIEEVYETSDILIQFTEPLNSTRDRYYGLLNHSEQLAFKNLINKYSCFYNFIAVLRSLNKENIFACTRKEFSIISLKQFESEMEKCFAKKFEFTNYIQLLETLKDLIKGEEKVFIDLFGRNIFAF